VWQFNENKAGGEL